MRDQKGILGRKGLIKSNSFRNVCQAFYQVGNYNNGILLVLLDSSCSMFSRKCIC